MTTNVQAIRRLFQVDASNDTSGNLPAMLGIYPDYSAPIVRNGASGREIAMARWGMPSSQKALMDATKKRAEKLQAKGKTVDFKELLRMGPDSGTTNIRCPNLCLKRCPRPKQIDNRPTNEPAKVPHDMTASPDSPSTASQMRFATGTAVADGEKRPNDIGTRSRQRSDAV